jgi:hypothetical protein
VSGVREALAAELERTMPRPDRVLERNQAITATYARWYLEHPAFAKWAGMATFASFQVGVFLSLGRRARVLGAPVELVVATNNAVFADIGWAHYACFSPAHGLSAVEDGLADRPEHVGLLQGFREIDDARRLQREGAGAGVVEHLVWSGNRALLMHEQRYTVERYFRRLPTVFSAYLSVAASTSFAFPPGRPEERSFFAPYLLRHDRDLLRETGALWPDLTRFEHRWRWIDGASLDLFRRADARAEPSMLERMRALAAQGGAGEAP